MERAVVSAADVLRLEIETAPRASLPEVGRRLWQAVTAGTVTDDEAEHLDGILRARAGAPGSSRTAAVQIGACRSIFPPKRRQRAPERTVLIERRRASAAAGWLPPAVASRFTVSEQSVLAVVVREIASKGACELAVDAVAALAGVSRRMVQQALRIAHDTGLILIEERRRHGDRNRTNRITILSRELAAWVKRRAGGGCRKTHPMSSEVQNPAGLVRLGIPGKGLGEEVGRPRRGRLANERVRDS
ncbi:hypothetical protein [Methylobacterium sp. SI9]|uniref:hypothetical protein n=1 Tax=Methylobacterium guangdongense TaxID=3138811 RepID=UPI00313A8588